MANKVTIDVEARFVDNVTNNAKRAAKAFDEVEKSAREATKEIDKVGKKKTTPKVDADTSRLDKKLSATDKKLSKLGKTKAEAKLTVLDKATAVVEKVTKKVKAFSGKTYSALLKIRDSNALSALQNGEVHYVTPQLTQNNIDILKGLEKSGIQSTYTDQLGYGYIGINAGKIPDIELRKAIM